VKNLAETEKENPDRRRRGGRKKNGDNAIDLLVVNLRFDREQLWK